MSRRVLLNISPRDPEDTIQLDINFGETATKVEVASTSSQHPQAPNCKPLTVAPTVYQPSSTLPNNSVTLDIERLSPLQARPVTPDNSRKRSRSPVDPAQTPGHSQQPHPRHTSPTTALRRNNHPSQTSQQVKQERVTPPNHSCNYLFMEHTIGRHHF